VDDLWATKSEDVGLIVRAISFQDFQPMWSYSTNVTDRQTDGQTTCDLKTVLCTIVHRVVKLCVYLVPFSSYNQYLSKVADFSQPHLHFGVTPFEFRQDLWRQKLESLDYRVTLFA